MQWTLEFTWEKIIIGYDLNRSVLDRCDQTYENKYSGTYIWKLTNTELPDLYHLYSQGNHFHCLVFLFCMIGHKNTAQVLSDCFGVI